MSEQKPDKLWNVEISIDMVVAAPTLKEAKRMARMSMAAESDAGTYEITPFCYLPEGWKKDHIPFGWSDKEIQEYPTEDKPPMGFGDTNDDSG